MFLLRGDGYVGELLELHQSVKDPFEAQREGGMSLEKPQCKSASSRVEGTISQFFSSCGTSPRTPSYNLRGIPIFLPQLEKNWEIVPSMRDEALLHCGFSRDIPLSL